MQGSGLERSQQPQSSSMIENREAGPRGPSHGSPDRTSFPGWSCSRGMSDRNPRPPEAARGGRQVPEPSVGGCWGHRLEAGDDLMPSWGLHLGWGRPEAGVKKAKSTHMAREVTEPAGPARPSQGEHRARPCRQPLLRKPPHSTVSA